MNEITFANGLDSLNGNRLDTASKTKETQNPESFGYMVARSL